MEPKKGVTVKPVYCTAVSLDILYVFSVPDVRSATYARVTPRVPEPMPMMIWEIMSIRFVRDMALT
eukprot:CAMPEP_0205909494 /NCGR_PEP_ID=MMETSP1325-20131115/3908_1 /ASSEMBLY_ACC=CAM_ASM_000708 /TAXON_ID=236786 /ORGANISM="Florenciella sp., Strain RCC1007" /LENGTH=65 /DNA_ID=CAMNT_0053275785 /DNA_START=160 /DNA_END=353 /DNA_ORIENTATION=+